MNLKIRDPESQVEHRNVLHIPRKRSRGSQKKVDKESKADENQTESLKQPVFIHPNIKLVKLDKPKISGSAALGNKSMNHRQARSLMEMAKNPHLIVQKMLITIRPQKAHVPHVPQLT